uniref:Retrotransposon Copia-like N-terminal domain-containing protein n=1 Tax=Chenopodium quinoa TaxID=63459 RepID=A0A803MNF7_CHEQI
MAAQDSLNQQSISASYADKFFLGSGDQPDQHLGSHKFNGDNFLTWNRSIRLALGAKNKLFFIDGSCRRPASDSPDLQKWIRNDYMVQSWLLNSMDKLISEGFILQQSAQQLYDEILERYGQSNAPQLFDLHKKLISIEQESDSIVQYYSKLKRVWDEIQLLEGFPDCDCGALSQSGLNRNYDAAKTNIISMDPLPTVNRAYYMLLQIERQHKLNEKIDVSSQTSAFATFKNAQFSQNSQIAQSGGRDVKRYKLHGYPPWYVAMRNKQSGGNSNISKYAGNVSEFSVPDSPLDFDDCMTSSKDPPVDTALVSVVYKEMMKIMKGKQSEATDLNDWIVDTGATDHMVCNQDLLSSCTLLPRPVTVGLPDGRLLEQNNLTAIFKHDSYVFQDSITSQVSAVGIKQAGYPYGQKGYKLYDLEDKKVILSRDVRFFEDVFPFKTGSSSISDSGVSSLHHNSMVNPAVSPSDIPSFPENNGIIQSPVSFSSDSVSSPDHPVQDPGISSGSDLVPKISIQVDSGISSDPPVLRRSSRSIIPSTKLQGFIVPTIGLPGQASSSGSSSFNAYACPVLSSLHKDQLPSLAKLLSHVEPTSYNQAKQDPVWVDAMNKELDALEKNVTWEVTDCPADYALFLDYASQLIIFVK